MKSSARFSVDPKLTALLGESYTSSERALRELVDNAWDAEARVVKITLPDILSEEPVIIDDDGHGMKNQEVRQEYLKIASPRFSRKGERTPNLDRKVKGRRGIGKFSGLTIGDEMEIVTRAQGVKNMDEYWTVCREIEEAEKTDVFIFANALDKFGLSDLAFIAHQADRRRAFLDGLDDLAKDPKTTEAQMHTALQHNLWIFGNEYSLMSSNRQLQSIVRDFTAKAYAGKDAADRPDLLLAANVENRHLLLEFKRPSIPVGRDAEHQAVKYADTLTGELGLELDILVVGGSVDPKLQSDYSGKKTRFLSYRAVIANARVQLEWLLQQLNEKP